MAIQRQLGLLSERRTGLSADYSADIGFNGSTFLSVGLAYSGHVKWETNPPISSSISRMRQQNRFKWNAELASPSVSFLSFWGLIDYGVKTESETGLVQLRLGPRWH